MQLPVKAHGSMIIRRFGEFTDHPGQKSSGACDNDINFPPFQSVTPSFRQKTCYFYYNILYPVCQSPFSTIFWKSSAKPYLFLVQNVQYKQVLSYILMQDFYRKSIADML